MPVAFRAGLPLLLAAACCAAASPASAQLRVATPPADSVVRPPDFDLNRAGRHPRGGAHFALVFGDSTDYTRHNAINVAALSSALLAVLWYLPDDFPRFETPDPTWSQFKQAWTRPPVLNDHDWWLWNWVGHPLVGMHEYLMERNWGSSQRRAFLFSTAASLVWEYGFEATIERPSVLDMLLTSPAGWLLGEGVHQLTQHLRNDGFSTTEKIVIVVLNPFYALQHGFR